MTTPMPCNVLTKLAVFTVLVISMDPAPISLLNITNPSQAGDHPAVKPAAEGVGANLACLRGT